MVILYILKIKDRWKKYDCFITQIWLISITLFLFLLDITWKYSKFQMHSILLKETVSAWVQIQNMNPILPRLFRALIYIIRDIDADAWSCYVELLRFEFESRQWKVCFCIENNYKSHFH